MAEAKIIKTSLTISQNLQKHLIKHIIDRNWTMLNMEILAQASYGEVINNIGEQSREKTCMGQQRGSHQVQVLAFSKETKKK